MIRMFMIATMMLFGTACAGGTPDEAERTQMSEDMAQTGGEERAMEMDSAEEGDPLIAPGTEGGIDE